MRAELVGPMKLVVGCRSTAAQTASGSAKSPGSSLASVGRFSYHSRTTDRHPISNRKSCQQITKRSSRRRVQHSGEARRSHEIVLIERLDPFAARVREVSLRVGGARPGALGVPDRRTRGSDRANRSRDVERLVGRTVVDDDDLEIVERLRDGAVESLREKCGAIVRRNANADARCHRTNVRRPGLVRNGRSARRKEVWRTEAANFFTARVLSALTGWARPLQHWPAWRLAA